MRCLICDDVLNTTVDDLDVCSSCLNQIHMSERSSITDVMMTEHDHLNERANPNAWAKEYKEADTYEQTLYEQSLYRGTRL